MVIMLSSTQSKFQVFLDALLSTDSTKIVTDSYQLDIFFNFHYFMMVMIELKLRIDCHVSCFLYMVAIL